MIDNFGTQDTNDSIDQFLGLDQQDATVEAKPVEEPKPIEQQPIETVEPKQVTNVEPAPTPAPIEPQPSAIDNRNLVDYEKIARNNANKEVDSFLGLDVENEAKDSIGDQAWDAVKSVGASLWGAIESASQISGDVTRGAIKGAAGGVAETTEFIGWVGHNLDKIDPLTHLSDIIGIGDPAGREKIFEEAHNSFKQIDTSLDTALPTGTAGDVTETLARFGVGLFGAGKFKAGITALTGNPALIGSATKGAIASMLGIDEQQKGIADLIESYPALKNPLTKFLSKGGEDEYALNKIKSFTDGIVGNAAAEWIGKGLQTVAKLAPFGWTKEATLRTARDEALEKLLPQLPKQVQQGFREAIEADPSLKDIAKGTHDAITMQYQSFLTTASHGLNILGNTSMATVRLAEKAIGRGVTILDDAVGGKILGGKPGVQAGEAMAKFDGMMQSLNQSFQMAGKALKTGQSAFGPTQKFDAPKELGAATFKADPNSKLGMFAEYWGKIVNPNFRVLGATDEFFRGLNYYGELHSLATKEAALKGLTGPALQAEKLSILQGQRPELLAQLQAAAGKEALRSTYARDPGWFAKGINQLRSHIPFGRVGVPFFNLIGNITKEGLERLPLTGPMFKEMRSAWAEGGVARADAIAKYTVGAAVALMYEGLASDGKIIADPEPGTWDVENATGRQPFSVNIGGKYIPLDQFDVLGQVLKTYGGLRQAAAKMVELYGDDDHDAMEAIGAGTMLIAKSFANNAWGESLISLFSTLGKGDAEKAGERVSNNIDKMLKDLTVPMVVQRTAQALDPYVRDAQGYLELLQKSIPGLSENLRIKYDVYGRELQPGRQGLGDVLNPARGSVVVDEKFDTFIRDKGFDIRMPTKQQSFDGIDVDLRKYPEVYTRMMELTGEVKSPKHGNKTLSETLSGLVAGEKFRSKKFLAAGDDEQERVVRAVINDYRELARTKIIRENEEFRIMIQNEKKLKRQADRAVKQILGK